MSITMHVSGSVTDESKDLGHSRLPYVTIMCQQELQISALQHERRKQDLILKEVKDSFAMQLKEVKSWMNRKLEVLQEQQRQFGQELHELSRGEGAQ